ncbi:uncharacterized protein [Diabrotica undecimpunctata]|uniref:uncharacterized protein isoform X1 n=1 Tax=Diabrotica undecimpunctata TaxID=50387 RepID=UPI003B638F99
MPRCIVKNCIYHLTANCVKAKKSVNLFSFPSTKEIREAWILFCNVEEKELTKIPRMCNLHFTEDSLDREKSPFKMHLKKNAVPTKNPPILKNTAICEERNVEISSYPYQPERKTQKPLLNVQEASGSSGIRQITSAVFSECDSAYLIETQRKASCLKPCQLKTLLSSPKSKKEQVTETQDSNISSDQEEVVDSETIDPLRSSVPSPKPRTSKRSYTTDPILEKAQNLLSNFGKEMKNEYASFGEHIANKLRKYDDYIRSEAEMKIMQILYECDMQMYKKRRLCTCTLLESPDTNS